MNKFRANKIFSILKENYPNAKCELNYSTPFQLLIATILSAQCTDIQVNKVTANLFIKYGSPKLLSRANILTIEKIIYSTGFYKNKSKNIVSVANEIIKKHNGIVPEVMEKLVSLPGVGRKTANVVLGNAFYINEGVVVDTHVKRISNLLKFTISDDPFKIEVDLIDLFPKSKWTILSHTLIFHGRKICKAKNALCNICPVKKYCLKFS